MRDWMISFFWNALFPLLVVGKSCLTARNAGRQTAAPMTYRFPLDELPLWKQFSVYTGAASAGLFLICLLAGVYRSMEPMSDGVGQKAWWETKPLPTVFGVVTALGLAIGWL